MSRVDDNSDAQRIRELNEAQLRKKVDDEKRTDRARHQASFNQVLTQRAQRRQAQKAQAEQAEQPTEETPAKQVLDRVRQQQPKTAQERTKRAALAHAMQHGLGKKQRADKGETNRAEAHRAGELMAHNEQELEHVDKATREDDDREVQASDERQGEVERAETQGSALGAIGEEEARRRHSGGGRRRQDNGNDGRNNGVQAAKGAGGAGQVNLPPEVVRQLVQTIYKGVAQDGRTHLQITLKGGLLDGVQMQVRSEAGKVRCEFSNCTRDLARLLNASKGALQRGLERRGLRLESFGAK